MKIRHFRRSKCLDSISLDIPLVRRDLHRPARDLIWDILREIDVVCVVKVIAAWKFSTTSAERIRVALELTLLIVEEHCSRRYQKLH